MVIKKNEAYLFFTILLLTLSNCMALIAIGLGSALEYLGYLFLLGGVLFSYFKTSFKYRKKNTSLIVALMVALMVPGIMIQEITMKRKLIVLFTILAIIIVSVMSEKFITNVKMIRIMAYACLTGVIISTFLNLALGLPIFRPTSEPTLGYAYFFNGGIRDKNVATMMIAIIMSLYIYSKEKGYYKSIDKIVIGISGIVLLLANSRGAWIEFFLFVILLNYKEIGRIAKAHRKLVVVLLIILATPVAIAFYNGFVMKSETYLYRYRGLVNYLNHFGHDRDIIMFGNGKLAYGSGVDYAIAVRRVTGWNGTIENAWLNILIKSGILGVIGYIILFTRALITAIKCDKMLYKTIYLAITVSLLVSSFVAIYIQTIHGLFGIYCYLIMGFFSGRIRENNYYKLEKMTPMSIIRSFIPNI